MEFIRQNINLYYNRNKCRIKIIFTDKCAIARYPPNALFLAHNSI